MSVLVRVVGCALVALSTVFLLLLVLVFTSWVTGWTISVPHVLAVARASGELVDGVTFDPNALGLVAVAGLLSTLFAAVDRPREKRVRSEG